MRKIIYLLPFLAFSTLCIAQRTISIQVSAPEDDLEEYIAAAQQTKPLGTMDAGSSDLELGSTDPGNVDPQLIGIRFAGLSIPRGSLIVSAQTLFVIDVQAHRLKDGLISESGLVEGGQLLFLQGQVDAITALEDENVSDANEVFVVKPNPFNGEFDMEISLP